MTKPLKVCLIGLKCYDHVVGAEVPRYLGGIETQLAVLAKGLARSGCDVSMITYDHGQPNEELVEGVRLLKSHAPDAGLPILRLLHPRGTGLWRAMRKADADIYLQMGAGYETGQTALGCRLLPGPRRKFVFCLASDANYGEDLKAGRMGWAGALYRHGLRNADLIVSQTVGQQAGLKNVTGLASRIIPMAASVPPQSSPARKPTLDRVLWIGRITPGKRLEWVLQAAQRLPQFSFDVVGAANHESDYATRLMKESGAIPNVTTHGRLPDTALNELFSQAGLLCCTSEMEGFPTTFLEAWGRGVPVVTSFDPDGLVARNHLGYVITDVEQLVATLQSIKGNETERHSVSEAVLAYHRAHHSVDVVTSAFVEAFNTMTDAREGNGVPVTA